MPAVTGAFPYNVDNVLGGAVRVLYTPVATALPDSIDDVINMVSPYAPKAGWLDFGATRDAFTYTRGFDTEGYEIQQVAGAILEDITDLNRTLSVSLAELTPETLAIVEQGTIAADVVAGPNVGAQDVVRFGSFSTVDQYRIAWIAQRHKGSGVVTEPGGRTRGRFFMGVGYRCQITADEIELEQEKGTLTAAGLAFKLFPESGQTGGEEYGSWFMEQAGTISAT